MDLKTLCTKAALVLSTSLTDGFPPPQLSYCLSTRSETTWLILQLGKPVSFRQSLRRSQRPCTLPGSPLTSVHFNTRMCCRYWGSHDFSCSENQRPNGSCMSAWIAASARYQSRVSCDPVWLSRKETLSCWIREMDLVCL